jgi:hypothetical protein
MSQRWYDKDPALSHALEQLRTASDKYQAQIALNIINIIVEHQIETDTNVQLNGSGGDNTHLVASSVTSEQHQSRRRWYDVNATLRSAMQLLQDCPEDLQRQIIPTIVRMIEQTLEEPFVR